MKIDKNKIKFIKMRKGMKIQSKTELLRINAIKLHVKTKTM